MNYYNEFDRFPAQWLRNLSDAGHISKGYVDERSITDVKPEDLRGYTQCHFFAGIGVWSHALRIAGWGDDREVWTGSCPCQPFSAAGRRGGTTDARHLWPEWFRLIKECRPRTIFGEQVASKDGLAWLDLVLLNLEAEGYTVGAVDICAAGLGAPHIRQRLFFVAELGDPEGKRIQDTTEQEGRDNSRGASPTRIVANARNGAEGSAHREEDNSRRPDGEQDHGDCIRDDLGDGVSPRIVAHTTGDGHAPSDGLREEIGTPITTGEECLGEFERGSHTRIVGISSDTGLQGDELGEALREVREPSRNTVGEPSPTNGFWADAVWLPCRDGKARATQPSIFPLAHGVTGRVGRLRAYGNAIAAPVAAEFIKAYMGG